MEKIKLILAFIGIWCIGFGPGLAVGLLSTRGTDRELENFGSESIAERHRIEGLNSQIRILKDGFAELTEANRKFASGFNDIGNTLKGLSESAGNNIEQLRRVIEALEEIQRTVGNFANH